MNMIPIILIVWKKCYSAKTHRYLPCTCKVCIYLLTMCFSFSNLLFCLHYIHTLTYYVQMKTSVKSIHQEYRICPLSYFPTFNLFIYSTIINYLLGILHEEGSIRLYGNLRTWSLSSSLVELEYSGLSLKCLPSFYSTLCTIFWWNKTWGYGIFEVYKWILNGDLLI